MALGRFLSFKTIFAILFTLVIIVYALFRFWPVITGVRIHLNPVKDTEGLVLLSGTAIHARELSINGLPISEDEQGNFAFQIASLPGINRARIFAQDKFGHSDTKLVEWYYNSPNPLDELMKLTEESPTPSAQENNGIQENSKETNESGTGSGQSR